MNFFHELEAKYGGSNHIMIGKFLASVQLLKGLKFVFCKKATKSDKIFIVDLPLSSKCQIEGEDFVNFCGLLRKPELYF